MNEDAIRVDRIVNSFHDRCRDYRMHLSVFVFRHKPGIQVTTRIAVELAQVVVGVVVFEVK